MSFMNTSTAVESGVTLMPAIFFSLMGVILAIYPFLALGRIWLYSKQQVELLREIRAILEQKVRQ
jgi:hypothetical protein